MRQSWKKHTQKKTKNASGPGFLHFVVRVLLDGSHLIWLDLSLVCCHFGSYFIGERTWNRRRASEESVSSTGPTTRADNHRRTTDGASIKGSPPRHSSSALCVFHNRLSRTQSNPVKPSKTQRKPSENPLPQHARRYRVFLTGFPLNRMSL